LSNADDAAIDAIRTQLRAGGSLPDALRQVTGSGPSRSQISWPSARPRQRTSVAHEDDLVSSPVGSQSELDEDLPTQHTRLQRVDKSRGEAQLHDTFIRVLAQSTASLFRILSVGCFVLQTEQGMRTSMTAESLLASRDWIITPEVLDHVICGTAGDNISTHGMASDRYTLQNTATDTKDDFVRQSMQHESVRSHHHQYDTHPRPLFQVQASRWTVLLISETSASHLISTFVTGPNSYWRLVEDDLFIRDLNQGRPGHSSPSLYCSALLVNAVLGFGCVSKMSTIRHKFTQD
jgi:hypothetical protein